ncbi:MAG TPA: ubiquitin-like domain-containing protein [Candidatus Saccharimonadaceae bacterium]|nr:ubiquitin-like domain-containing protein [Candidatus Saccharimonadaceae bacterium]
MNQKPLKFHESRFSAKSLGIFAGSFIAVILSITIAISVHAAAVSSNPTDGQSLITIHDNGTTHAIMTRDSTLGAALRDAGVTTASQDLVEPSLTTKLTVSNYDVNIYRARPVTIVDGSVKKDVMSPYRTADQIVEHAGMTLHDEDRTTLVPNSHIAADGPGLTLTIDRATPFTLELYGQKVAAYTQGKTVADMIKEKGIHLAPSDTVSLPLTTPIIAGMTVEIWREGVNTVTNQEPIPFSTQEIQNADEPIGYKQIQTPGKNGAKMVTYQINMQHGQQVSKTQIQSVVIAQPVTEVEVVGTKLQLPPGSHSDWMSAAGISSSDYGYVNYIVSHEGGWNPCKVQGGAVDCSYLGGAGYGVVQATPGIKMSAAGVDWQTNPITQLRWATSYANEAKFVPYGGGWEGAYNYWVAHHNW